MTAKKRRNISDKERLDWLGDTTANLVYWRGSWTAELVCDKEEDDICISRRGKDPRITIDAAMRRERARGKA